MSAYSNDSRRQSYHNSRRDTKSCYQSSRSRETEFASEKHHNKRASSRRTEALSESEGSVGGHWKSKSKRQKSSIEEDDLSQPWVCEETDPFTPPLAEEVHQRSGRNSSHQAKRWGIHKRVCAEVQARMQGCDGSSRMYGNIRIYAQNHQP
ncbi:hypothetical protein Tco_0131690 [Tanacetum coccineum]